MYWIESEIDTRPELLMQIEIPISLICLFSGDPAALFTCMLIVEVWTAQARCLTKFPRKMLPHGMLLLEVVLGMDTARKPSSYITKHNRGDLVETHLSNCPQGTRWDCGPRAGQGNPQLHGTPWLQGISKLEIVKRKERYLTKCSWEGQNPMW